MNWFLSRGARARGVLRRRSRQNDVRRGNIVVLAAFLMIGLGALLALAIDVGFMYTMQTQLDRAVDAAALAGAGSLVDGEAAATDEIDAEPDETE